MRQTHSRPADRSWFILILTFICWLAISISWIVAMLVSPAKAHGAEVLVADAIAADVKVAEVKAAPAIAKLPEPVTSFGAAVLDEHLYIVGGHVGDPHDYSSKTLAKGFYRINLKAPVKWEELAPTRRLQGLAMVAHGRHVYRIGGLEPRNDDEAEGDLHSVDDVARFNSKTGKWEDCTPLPEARSSHDAVVVGDDVIVIGGWKMAGDGVKGQWHKTVWAANLTQWPIKWRALAETPFERRAMSVAAAGGKVVVIGGLEPKGGTTAAVAILDLATNRWSEGKDFPGSDRMKGFGSSAFGVGGFVYANGWDTQLQVYDVKLDEWKPFNAKLAQPRFFHRLVARGSDELLLAGGASKGGQLDDVEVVKLDTIAGVKR